MKRSELRHLIKEELLRLDEKLKPFIKTTTLQVWKTIDDSGEHAKFDGGISIKTKDGIVFLNSKDVRQLFIGLKQYNLGQ